MNRSLVRITALSLCLLLALALAPGASPPSIWAGAPDRGAIQVQGGAPTPHLVKDINTTTPGANLRELTAAGDPSTIYFVDYRDRDAVDLYKSDGTEAGTTLVQTIQAGYWDHPYLHHLTPVDVPSKGDQLFFRAYDAEHGDELWVSDGTPSGTAIVKDITPGGYGALGVSTQLVNAGGTLFFSASGTGLWTSDGTEAGTVQVHDNPYGSVEPDTLTAAGESVFYVSYTAEGPGLWTSDGTPGGAVLLHDDYSPKKSLTYIDGALYYVVERWGAPGSSELWTSDGTEAGTQMVTTVCQDCAIRDPMVAVGDTLYLAVLPYSTYQWELWASDGTEAGTVSLKVLPGEPQAMTPVDLSGGSALFFVADDGAHGRELWVSDGTPAGTSVVKEIRPGAESAFPDPQISPAALAALDGALYFAADDGTHGYELWTSDGTETGTVLVRDILPGAEGSFPSSIDMPAQIGTAGDTLFFVAEDGAHGLELWASDGTAGGTSLVKDINVTPQGAYPGPQPHLAAAGGKAFFTPDDGIHGQELWVSDGTATGTFLVVDLLPGSEDGVPVAGELAGLESKGLAVFRGDDGVHGQELWVSDGTSAGTTLLKDIHSGEEGSWPEALTVISDTLYFAAADETHGRELWKSDGTPEGTVMVKDIEPGGEPSSPYYFTALGDVVLFIASVDYEQKLWVTDGTEAGTVQVADVRVGSPAMRIMARAGDKVFFRGYDETHEWELWVTDGTTAGTAMVKDIHPWDSSEPHWMTAVGNTLFFAADDGIHGKELWTSDGTEAGTVLVKEIDVGPSGSGLLDLTDLNGTLYFAGGDGSGAYELWKSDGTEAGTVEVDYIVPGPGYSSPRSLTAVDGVLYLTAADDAHGSELWKTDGTEAGTALIADIYPGPTSGCWSELWPVQVPQGGLALFFVADDGQHGEEWWALQLVAPPSLPRLYLPLVRRS